jgi:hypothetical protein
MCIVLFIRYYLGDKFNKKWMVRECGTYGRQAKGMQLVGRSGRKDHLEDLGQDGRTILKWSFKKRDGGHELDRSVLGYGQLGELLWMRQGTSRCNEIRGISCLSIC